MGSGTMKSTKELLNGLDIERIYTHIFTLHYERSPVFSMDNLKKAQHYIETQFTAYGLTPELYSFTLKGDRFSYSNVQAKLNPELESEILITSHFDHMKGSPGADDNLSAVAIMLEIARICKKGHVDVPIEFISFNLEEQNPFLHKKTLEKGIELDLHNEREIPKTLHFQKMRDLFSEKSKRALRKGIDRKKIYETVFHEIEDDLTEIEKEYFSYQIDLAQNPESRNWIDFFALNGSSYYVEDLVTRNAHTSLKGVINLETCGYTSKEPHSQTLPTGLDIRNFPSYKIDDPTVGDFISIISDKNSSELGNSFLKSCEEPDIDLPGVLIGVPLPFEQINKSLPDLLRSDHAPFWKAHIPAVMITDTADFRNPYYHTPADTITTLDFDFILQVAKATFLTALKHFKPL
jgi:hypothetical protein